jgi:hypothetical protein
MAPPSSAGASKVERALEVLKSVIGELCWSAIASVKTDYVIALDLGEKRRRAMRLANPRLSFLQRTYEGEFSLLVECTWRLDGPRGVVASCFDSNQPGGMMHRALVDLESRMVEDIRVENAGRDLTVIFGDGYVLRTLCTETDPKRKRSNWSFWSPSGSVTVGPRGALAIESSAEAVRRLEEFKRTLANEEEDVVSKFTRETRGELRDEAGDDDDAPEE